jgi:hypothetical protein
MKNFLIGIGRPPSGQKEEKSFHSKLNLIGSCRFTIERVSKLRNIEITRIKRFSIVSDFVILEKKNDKWTLEVKKNRVSCKIVLKGRKNFLIHFWAQKILLLFAALTTVSSHYCDFASSVF